MSLYYQKQNDIAFSNSTILAEPRGEIETIPSSRQEYVDKERVLEEPHPSQELLESPTKNKDLSLVDAAAAAADVLVPNHSKENAGKDAEVRHGQGQLNDQSIPAPIDANDDSGLGDKQLNDQSTPTPIDANDDSGLDGKQLNQSIPTAIDANDDSGLGDKQLNDQPTPTPIDANDDSGIGDKQLNQSIPAPIDANDDSGLGDKQLNDQSTPTPIDANDDSGLDGKQLNQSIPTAIDANDDSGLGDKQLNDQPTPTPIDANDDSGIGDKQLNDQSTPTPIDANDDSGLGDKLLTPSRNDSNASDVEEHLELREDYSHSPKFSSSNTSDNLNLWKTLWIDGIAEFKNLTYPFKSPSRRKTISLYNETLYNDLISNLIQSHMQGRNFTIVTSGGSTTCGARTVNATSIVQENRYYSKFGSMLNSLLPPLTNRTDPTVVSIGQGHGERKSLHTSIFLDSFVPMDTDLLVWEFSINDGANFDRRRTVDRCRVNLLSFLYEVAKRKQPPKVILLYYWDTTYSAFGKGNFTVLGNAFKALEALGDIRRKFDFVLGHVNMAGYIEEFHNNEECRSWKTCPLLNDVHHASEMGHDTTAFQLLNILDPSKQSLLPLPSEGNTKQSHSDLYKYEWLCGTETPEKQFLKEVTTNSSTGWKSPLGAWTFELPSVEDYSSSKRLIAGQTNMEIHILGKQDPNRQDRQRVTPLPSCGSDPSTLFSVHVPREPMKDVQVMLLNLRPLKTVLNTGHIGVHINNSSAANNGTFVPVRGHKSKLWACNLGWSWGVHIQTYFYILEEPISSVHSVGLCSASKLKPPPMILSAAFW